MKSLLTPLIPKYKAFVSPQGRVSSLRWLNTGWDAIISKRLKFIQFGKNPVKFICLVPKGIKFPIFILAAKWEIKFNSPRLKVGITRAPLNLTKLWGTL